MDIYLLLFQLEPVSRATTARQAKDKKHLTLINAQSVKDVQLEQALRQLHVQVATTNQILCKLLAIFARRVTSAQARQALLEKTTQLTT